MGVSEEQLLRWAEDPTSEAEVGRRAAISRAYYATYHKCKSYPEEYHLAEEPGKGMHETLINSLIKGHGPEIDEATQRKLRSIGYKLRQARDRRKNADYEIGIDITDDDVQVQLIATKGLINAAKEFDRQKNGD